MISALLEGVTHQYAKHHRPAVQDVFLSIHAGEVFCLLGPSGSGKTTILKLLAGLIKPEIGRVCFDERDVSAVSPEHRDAVMVFQNPLLFPFMTVGENVAFGLRMAKMAEAERNERVKETLAYVRLEGFDARRINQLSGGQKQRVALARALALRPGLLLLDEPLSNLDEHLRDEMRDLICATRATYDTTIVIVTHDRHDAAALSDRMAVILEGRVCQVGQYRKLLESPASRNVAEFLGNRNWLQGTKRGLQIDSPIGSLCIPEGRAGGYGGVTNQAADSAGVPDGPVWVSIRPEDLRVGETGAVSLTGEVVRSMALGSHNRCRIRVNTVELDLTLPASDPLPSGRVPVSFDPGKIIVLPREPS